MTAFGMMLWFARYLDLPTWVLFIINNVFILGFVYRIIQKDLPLSRIPIIGKKFKKTK